MRDEREPGATFAIDDIGWLDFESRGRLPISVGTYRYAMHADAVVLAYAIGRQPVEVCAVMDFSQPLTWQDLPEAVHRHHQRVERGEAIWAAWNAGFDRAIWNYATLDFPFMQPRHIIDVMAQGVASGLPPDLAGAAKASQSVHKVASGKHLIDLFCLPESTATPQSHPAEWQEFVNEYASGDIESLRSIFLGTRQLPLAEWREYWAMERINERGIGIDLEMVGHAAELAKQDRHRSAEELRELTDGFVTSADQVSRMTAWLLRRLPVEGREILLKRQEETDEEGNIVKPGKFTLQRRQVERLLALCAGDAKLADATRLLQIRLYGGSKTPAKFGKMLLQHIDGVLLGQYVFNGAAQTGRASSKGVQCVTGDHEALTRNGWRRLDELVGPCEIMAWSCDSSMHWETGIVHAFDAPDKMAHINGTMIRGVYTLDHRMPNRHAPGSALIDYTPQMIIDRNARLRGGFVIAGIVDQPDAYLTDVQLRLRVAMQADGYWEKRAVQWRFTKIRKIERLEMLLDEAGVRFRRKTEKDGVTLFRIATADVPPWLVKDFGPWVLTLSARQAALVLEEIRLWDGCLQRGHLQIASPRKDQMEWVVTIAALAGRSATLNGYPYGKYNGKLWVVFIRSSITTSLYRHDVKIIKGNSPVFCPTIPSGYWLCRIADRVFVTGNTHNLSRDALPYEAEAIDALLDKCDYETLANLGNADPVARKLSLLIRPACVAQPNNIFVWSDWSQIEARIVPWLADHLPGARARLQIFRDVDADPSLPDLYTRTAAEISRIPISEVTKPIRQRGKVVELSSGFLGGVGALHSMAANYGMHLTDDDAKQIVRRWREANPWVAEYGRELWEAMTHARRVPGQFFAAGRVGFIFLRDYLGGSLLCRLPSGRLLTYRAIRDELVDITDDDDNVIGRELKLTFARGRGRVALWKGSFVENCIAEGTLVLTETGWLPIEQITNERVWDGNEWVEHDGLIDRDIQSVIELDGVYLTPDHKVLTTRGWQVAESIRCDTMLVGLPDGYSFCNKRSRRARVYDLLNAGRQHRFVVAGLTAPFIVSNCTQATAADFLRGTLVRLENMPVKLHTHDEILVEVPETEAKQTVEYLREVMRRGFDWSAGLPLMSEETVAYYYSKNEKAYATYVYRG